VGGWLPKLAGEDAALCNRLKRFDGLWVETTSMQQDLSALGITKVTVVPNFKYLDILPREQLRNEYGAPHRLCTFSRVMAEKGITDAVEAVAAVNMGEGRRVFELDIYGPVSPEYAAEFSQLQQKYADWVCYKGVADPSDSVRILKDYFALLFPTRFYTEGIPGTIIDAYSAGVPIVTARWLNCADIFDDGVTGIGYEFGKQDELRRVLADIASRPELITNKKEACLEKARQYQPQPVIEQLVKLIEG
jgi:glycosyltransferase involved in cell wall biosynthesis